MKKFATIAFLSSTLALAACNQAEAPAETEGEDATEAASLAGTWTSDKVAVSGHGVFDGTSSITYNDDGTYSSNAEFTNPETGCVAKLTHTGTYSSDDTSIEVEATGGDVEVTGCTDETQNVESRAHEAAELEPAKTSVAYSITDGVLSVEHSDGLERTYQQ